MSIDDVSDALAALALQGPTSRDVLRAVSDVDVDGLAFFRLADGYIGDIPATISRTGYTGDLGYEIWVDAAHAVALWEALMIGGQPFGLTPTGMLALDLARIEAGLVLIDVDYIPAPPGQLSTTRWRSASTGGTAARVPDQR